jgi:hypothetical protein
MMDQCLSMMPQGVGHRYALLWKLHSVKVWLTLDALRRSCHQSRAYLIKKIVLASGSTETLAPKCVLWITTHGFSARKLRFASLAKRFTTGSDNIQGICRKSFGLVLIRSKRMSVNCGQLRRVIGSCNAKFSTILISEDRSTRQYGGLLISIALCCHHLLACSSRERKYD